MIIPLNEKKLPEFCFIFKHSTQCPISSTAADEVRSADASMSVYWIDVIEQRDLSDWVETQYDLRHESPQLIQIEDGKVKESWSHRAINKDLLSPT